MGSKGHNLACHEAVAVLIAQGAEGGPFEQRGEIERSQSIKNDNFVSSISVNRLVQWKVGRGIVKGEVQRG